jgi:hypothetical protein
MLKANGFDEAVIGVGRRCSQPDLIVYSIEKCLAILVKQGMSDEEAEEYFEFNVVGGWVGEETPMWMNEMTCEEVEIMADECTKQE